MDNRLAKIALKALKAADSNEFSVEEEAGKLTDDKFEARLIGLASHWSNDLIDAAFEVLEIKSPYNAFYYPESESWLTWYQKTVDDLVI